MAKKFIRFFLQIVNKLKNNLQIVNHQISIFNIAVSTSMVYEKIEKKI